MPRRVTGAGPAPVRRASSTGRDRRCAWPRGVAGSVSVTRGSSGIGRCRPGRVTPLLGSSRDGASASQRATTTVTWAWLATCSDTLPWSVLARLRERRGCRRRSCRSRARRRPARWCGRRRPRARASRPRSRPRAGPVRASRSSSAWTVRSSQGSIAVRPERTGTTLITPTSASNRVASSIVCSSARLAGSPPSYASRIFFMLGSFRAGRRRRPRTRATGTRLPPRRSILPAPRRRPAARGPRRGAEGHEIGMARLGGDRPGGALRPDRRGLRPLVVARAPSRDARAARRDRPGRWTPARRGSSTSGAGPGRWPPPRSSAGRASG